MMTEREIGIIIAKLDSLKEDMIEIKELQSHYDKRIDTLERFKSWSVGVGSACIAVFSFLIHLISRS